MSKSNVVLNIEDTIRRIEHRLETKPTQSAWMIPLREDLTLLLAEARTTSDSELDRKLRAVLDKHQPMSEEKESEE
jgi:hypothetical protein